MPVPSGVLVSGGETRNESANWMSTASSSTTIRARLPSTTSRSRSSANGSAAPSRAVSSPTYSANVRQGGSIDMLVDPQPSHVEGGTSHRTGRLERPRELVDEAEPVLGGFGGDQLRGGRGPEAEADAPAGVVDVDVH